MQKHKYLHQSWVMYDMQYGLSIDDILAHEDPDDWLRLPRDQQQINNVLDSHQSTLKCTAIKPTAKCFIAELYMGDRTPRPQPIAENCLQAYQLQTNPQGNYPIVLDTGASASLTPCKNDFVGEITTKGVSKLKGIGTSMAVNGKGWVEWPVQNLFGVTEIIRTKAYYMPTVNI